MSILFFINIFATAGNVNSIALFNLRPISMDAIGADADLLYSLEVEFEKSSQLSVMSRRDIEAVLHRIGGAQVSDTNLVIAYGQEMGVGFILTGDVDKTGSSMKVTLNLVDIIGERVVNVWHKSYTGRGDVLQGSKALAKEIKQSILTAAQANISSVNKTTNESTIEYLDHVTAVAKGSGVFLSWTINDKVSVFYTNVYRGQSVDGLFEFVASVEETQFQDDIQGDVFYRLDLVLDNGNEIKGEQIVSAKASTNLIDVTLLPPIVLSSKNLLHGIKIDLVPQLNNQGVLGYNFYQKVNDDQWKKVHSINKTDQLTYSLVLNKNFISNASYQLYVTAYSALGESDRSDTLLLTIHPSLQLNVNKDKILRKAELSWKSAKTGKGYKIYRRETDDRPWQLTKEILGIDSLSFTDQNNLKDGQEYQYSITAFDEFTETLKSKTAFVKTKDLPPAPENLKVQSGLVKTVKLTWQASDDQDVSGYVVFRQVSSKKSEGLLEEVAFLEGYQTQEFIDGLGEVPLQDGETYFYAIAAKNLFGSLGKVSLTIETQTKPLPQQPQNFKVSNGENTITLSWQANNEIDIDYYALYRRWNSEPWQKISESKNTHYQDDDLKVYAKTQYKITATDKSGLISKPSQVESIDSPLSLTLSVQKEFMPRAITLAWNKVKYIKGYKLYRKQQNQSQWQLIKTIKQAKQSSFKDFDQKKMREGQQYQYKLTAFDNVLETVSSNIVSGTTQAQPLAPRKFSAQSNQVKMVTLTWDKTSDLSAKGYVIYQENDQGIYEEIEKISKITTTTFKDDGSFFSNLKDGTSYSYKITTYNQFSAEGPLSDLAEATTKAIPKTISGLSIEQDASGLMLFWQPLMGKDIKHYLIHRSSNSSCTSLRKVATVNSAEDVYLDAEVKSGKSYCYQISAVDNEQLEGKLSQRVNFTMPTIE
ncbi:MAG: fibronectin type III domain-containing protein [Colwellia sp.]|nr:fibronectin type III domain-containing protein [Colwellia sp.]